MKKTLGQAFRETYIELKNAGNENPHLEAGWIIEKFVDVDSTERIVNPEKSITVLQTNEITNATKRRTDGEPLAYILQEKEFFGLKFKVTPDVLIPRPETEHLVEWAAEWMEKRINLVPTLDILDLGAGSGCIGLSLLKNFVSSMTTVRLTILDISKDALAVAKENAKALHLLDKVEFIHLDAKKANFLLKSFDLVVANPPYIDREDIDIAPDVKKYEPHQALFAGGQGLDEIKGWLQALPNILKPESAVGFEIGASQGPQVLEMFRTLKIADSANSTSHNGSNIEGDQNIFSKQYILKDYAKHDRVVCGEVNTKEV